MSGLLGNKGVRRQSWQHAPTTTRTSN